MLRIDFDSQKDYEKAVEKTNKHFNRACKNMIRTDFTKENEVSISFADAEKDVYYMIYTNPTYNGTRDEMNSAYDESKLSDSMCYQFSKSLISE